jgi:hypothetical protein
MELPRSRPDPDVDAVREGETGLLVPARDAGALTPAIRTYLATRNCGVSTAPMAGTARCAILIPKNAARSLVSGIPALACERGCEEVVKSVCPNPDHSIEQGMKTTLPVLPFMVLLFSLPFREPSCG